MELVINIQYTSMILFAIAFLALNIFGEAFNDIGDTISVSAILIFGMVAITSTLIRIWI